MTLRNLTDALTACELPIPKAAAAWLAIGDALHADTASHQIQQPDHVIDEVTPKNATEYVDRLVRQRLELDERRMVAGQLIATAEGRAARAIQADADKLIVEYRDRFDAAAQTVTANAAAFSPDARAEDVLTQGPEAAAAWHAISQASTVLDAGLHLWSTLHEQPPTTDAVIETYDGTHWRRIDSQTAFDTGRWHALAAAGYKLRLNTYTETQKLIKDTPERTLRVESTNVNGFRGLSQVRA